MVYVQWLLLWHITFMVGGRISLFVSFEIIFLSPSLTELLWCWDADKSWWIWMRTILRFVTDDALRLKDIYISFPALCSRFGRCESVHLGFMLICCLQCSQTNSHLNKEVDYVDTDHWSLRVFFKSLWQILVLNSETQGGFQHWALVSALSTFNALQ